LETLLLALTTPFMVVLIVFELIYSHFSKKQLYTKGDTFINLLCTSWNFINDLLFRVITLFVLTWASSFSVFHFNEKGIIYWLLLFLAEDFAYYVLHFADHHIRFFWATHITHHSSEKFNFTVAIRSSVFQPFYRFVFYLPLAFLGFEALDIVFMYAACQVYGFWVHTEIIGKLPPWFEFVFVTPSHHRVHHGANPIYLDKNMGMALIIWDRIFGTFQEELKEEPVKYGLTTNVRSYHPLKVVFFEWNNIINDLKQIQNRRHFLKYIFGPPGWSHDGSRKTSKELKIEWMKNNNNEIEINKSKRVEVIDL
jgi:sterol desaturase/sphingolipid hydroxylase (fatty acid hydroxylase superfamily)